MNRQKLIGAHAGGMTWDSGAASAQRSARGNDLARVLLLLLGLLGGGLLGAAQAQAQDASAMEVSVVQTETVDINSADASTIASALTGVGQSKAEAIVRYREEFGPFESVEELTEVKGIGAATLERNRPRIKLQ